MAPLTPWSTWLGELVLAGGLSQEALADVAGVDRSYMSGIERGVRNITLLKLFAAALRVRATDRLE